MGEKGDINQEPISIYEAVSGILRHLYVRQVEPQNDTPLAQPPLQKADRAGVPGRSKRSKRKAKPPRRGGWPSTRYITRELCREMRAGAGLLALARYPFTVFATARAPLGLTDGQAKRHIARSFARLGQALERKGHDYIGLASYEKPVGGLLHGHALLHVQRECLPVVKRWADRFDERPARPREQVESVALHARPAIKSDLDYVLKQRRFNGPYERPGLPYQRSEPFAGTRVSFTKMARLIIEKTERQRSKSRNVAPPLVVSNPVMGRAPKQAEAA
jgi:hypothetical protein